MNRTQQREQLAAALKPSRFTHSIQVEQTVICMAKRFGIDKEQAQVAGLLHDCAKGMEPKVMRQILAPYRRFIDDQEWATDELLHAPAGAVVAYNCYGIKDQPVLQAIRWHTVGHVRMSSLAKIVFIADVIEPGRRPYPGLDELRQAAETDLDYALLIGLRNNMDYLKRQNKSMHHYSIELYNELLTKFQTERKEGFCGKDAQRISIGCSQNLG